MNLNIKNAVIDNLRNSNADSIYSMIEDASSSSDETVLPGLGVILGLYWKTLSQEDKTFISNKIKSLV